MGNVFYTSDLHIGHNLVAAKRGFSTTEEHDEHLAWRWDTTVGWTDHVWILGDISINGGQHALDWIADRPGRKHLITGNHDPVGPHDRRAPRLMRHWMQYFESIQPMARRKLGGVNFIMSHYPYWPHDRDPEAPRMEQYRAPDTGLPLLHGHTHGDQGYEFPNSLHVGWDAWGELVPQENVQKWLDNLATP